MRLGGAFGRMIKLGERKGRKQLVTACALLIRDGDRGLEGLLGQRGIGDMLLKQDAAPNTIQEGEVEAIFGLICERHRFVGPP